MISLKKMINGVCCHQLIIKENMLNVNVLPNSGIATLKCFVIDAEKEAAAKLEVYIRETPGLEFIEAGAGLPNVEKVLFNEGQPPDIVFLEVNAKDDHMLNLAKRLMGKACVVFTTIGNQFIVESYRLNVVDYLVKPLSYKLFLEAVGKCRLMSEILGKSERPELLFLKDALSGKAMNVNQNEILYIQSIGNYCKVFFIDNKQIMPHLSLKQLLSRLNTAVFIRIHKSNVINLRHIRFYDGNGTVQLANEVKLEVGRTFKKMLKQKIKGAHGN
jgi:DNA-binding LytR/AlgR family response regulator